MAKPSAGELMQALLDSMQDLTDATANVKTMIYGESGVGKTVLAMEMAQRLTPGDKRILFLDTYEGWVSLLNHPELKKRSARMKYQGLSQIDLLVQAIQADTPFADIGTVVVDEISSIAKKDLDNVLNTRAAKDPSKDRDVATQPDMGANTERMRRTFGDLLAMDINVILVSHIREDADARTGVKTIRPGMMPKMSVTIREQLHDVVHMTADEIRDEEGNVGYTRSLQVLPTRGVVAKTRVGGLDIHTSTADYIRAVGEWMRGDRESLDPETIEVADDLESMVVTLELETDENVVGVEID